MKRLEYIQSTREQRIDTGLKLDNTCEIEMRVAQLKCDGFLYWLRLIGSNGEMEIICQQGTDNSISVNWVGNSWSNLKSIEYEVPYTLKLNAEGFFVDGEQVYVNTNKPTFSTNNTITIFSYPTDSGNSMNRMRLYELTIRRGGVEIAHFLPYLDDNGVPCIYDDINEVFKYDTIYTTPFEYLEYGYKWDKIVENYNRTEKIYAVKWKNSGSFEGFFSEIPNVNADDATLWNYYGLDNAEMGYCTENRFDCTRKQFSNRFYGFIDEKWENQTHTIKVSDGYVFTFPKEMYWAGKITNYDYAAAANCFEVLIMDKSLIVEPEEIEFGYNGGSQQINIVSRGEYTYTTDGDFDFRQNEDGILVTAQFNSGDADKVGSVVFTSEDGEVVTVSINQKHMLIPFVVDKYKHYDYNIYKEYRNNSVVKKVMRNNALVYVGSVIKPTLKLEKKEISVFKQGGTIFVGVTSNTQYTATSDADYVSVEVVDGGINIVADPQTGVSMVTITVTAGNDDTVVTDTITLTYVTQNDNEIWFTTVNNETPISSLYGFTVYNFMGNPLSKTLLQYGDKWILRCSQPIAKTRGNFFYNTGNGPQITSISLPRTLNEMGTYLTFYGQENLQSIDGESPLIVDGHYLYTDTNHKVLLAAKSGEDVMTIPEGTTELYGYAISYNHVTKVIDLPSTITKIGEYCFEDSRAFNKLRMRMDEPPTAGTGMFNAVNQSGEIVVNQNQSTVGWSIVFPKPSNFTFVNATE